MLIGIAIGDALDILNALAVCEKWIGYARILFP